MKLSCVDEPQCIIVEDKVKKKQEKEESTSEGGVHKIHTGIWSTNFQCMIALY